MKTHRSWLLLSSFFLAAVLSRAATLIYPVEAIDDLWQLPADDFRQKYAGINISGIGPSDEGWYVRYRHENLTYLFGPLADGEAARKKKWELETVRDAAIRNRSNLTSSKVDYVRFTYSGVFGKGGGNGGSSTAGKGDGKEGQAGDADGRGGLAKDGAGTGDGDSAEGSDGKDGKGGKDGALAGLDGAGGQGGKDSKKVGKSGKGGPGDGGDGSDGAGGQQGGAQKVASAKGGKTGSSSGQQGGPSGQSGQQGGQSGSSGQSGGQAGGQQGQGGQPGGGPSGGGQGGGGSPFQLIGALLKAILGL